MKIVVDTNHMAAVLANVAPLDSPREYLTGFYVDLSVPEDVRIVGTDGAAMVSVPAFIQSTEPGESMDSMIYRVMTPKDFPKTKKKGLYTTILTVGNDLEWPEITCARVPPRGNNRLLPLKQIQLKYPDWRKVMPGKGPGTGRHGEIGLDSTLLTRTQKALGGETGFCRLILQSDRRSSIRVIWDNEPEVEHGFAPAAL